MTLAANKTEKRKQYKTALKNKLSKHSLCLSLLIATCYSSISHSAVCEYIVNDEWNGGFTATVRITNDTETAINGWQVNWQYENSDRQTSGWNATISGSNPYEASNLNWNAQIAPGNSAEFGIQGSKSNGNAESVTILGDICSTPLDTSAKIEENISDTPKLEKFPPPTSPFLQEPLTTPAITTQETKDETAEVTPRTLPRAALGTKPESIPAREKTPRDNSNRVDNPFTDAKFYIDPNWSAKASAEPGGKAIAGFNTAVWMDRIGAITDGIGLRGHLDEALKQEAKMFMFVVYDLPNRDCAALASSGELRISENGFEIYKNDYIAPIKAIISDPKYSDLNIVAIIEVDSLPILVTNLDTPDCAEANGPGGYRDGIQHTLNELSDIPNVYAYLDVANSGWLGWTDNFSAGVALIGKVVESTDNGWDSIAGFVTNSANYAPTIEPYLTDPNLSIGGMPIRSSSFYEWNAYFDEKTFAQDWREAMIERGAPSTIGMLIDTARNGWGGPDRPTQQSKSTDIDTFVDESRVDRRIHRGNWCNQPGGVGFKPWADPYEGIDAFVWVKPQGESDGISDPNFTPDPNDPAKRHDPMCDPNATRPDGKGLTGALKDAPHAGRWHSEAFNILLNNAYPPADEPAAPPPPPVPPRSDCKGLDPEAPLTVSAGSTTLVDLGCAAPIYVQFSTAPEGEVFVENTGSEFNVTIEASSNRTVASGYFKALSLSGINTVIITRNDVDGAATSIKLRY